MDARFQWPRCRRMGVIPRGAQVRRTGGRSEHPDSSRKHSHAPRLSAPLDPGPLLGPPAGDLDLVTLGCAAGGPLQAPAESPQDAPHVPRMEADSGELLDDLGDATKGPLVGIEPERFWSLAQRLGDRLQFRRRPARPAARNAGSPPWCQRRYQTLAACRDTPKVLATSAWVAPRANIRAASRRRCSRPPKSRRQVPVLIGIAAPVCGAHVSTPSMPVRITSINLFSEAL